MDWKDWINTVQQGDCLELMKEIADKSVVILTDPVWPNARADIPGKEDPYGLFARAAKLMNRIAHRIIIHLGTDSDPRIMAPLELPFIRQVTLRYAQPHYKGRILYGNDVAYVYGSLPTSIPGRRVLPGEYCHTNNREWKADHPCPRRLSHTMFLVDNYTDPDDIVVDPFAGSGTTLVACKKRGRQFIGLELVEEYVKMARQRLGLELSDQRLAQGMLGLS